jgi:hypothetical protein
MKKRCTNLLEKGLPQCRYLLKKKYFDIDPNDLPQESPVPSMNNGERKALVDHWRHQNGGQFLSELKVFALYIVMYTLINSTIPA